MPVFALIGISLGIFLNEWWFIFPVLVLLFFLQHAIQGWCPPLPVFRKLGYRTKDEIHKEKYALKILRGDFRAVSGVLTHTGEAVYRVCQNRQGSCIDYPTGGCFTQSLLQLVYTLYSSGQGKPNGCACVFL